MAKLLLHTNFIAQIIWVWQEKIFCEPLSWDIMKHKEVRSWQSCDSLPGDGSVSVHQVLEPGESKNGTEGGEGSRKI